jgi:hypothetical protein
MNGTKTKEKKMAKIQNTYEDIIRIHGGMMDRESSREEIVESVDRDIEIMGGFYQFAFAYNALNDTSCENFAIAHMSEYNNTFGPKY